MLSVKSCIMHLKASLSLIIAFCVQKKGLDIFKGNKRGGVGGAGGGISEGLTGLPIQNETREPCVKARWSAAELLCSSSGAPGWDARRQVPRCSGEVAANHSGRRRRAALSLRGALIKCSRGLESGSGSRWQRPAPLGKHSPKHTFIQPRRPTASGTDNAGVILGGSGWCGRDTAPRGSVCCR